MKKLLILILFFIVGYLSAQPACGDNCTTCNGSKVCIDCVCQNTNPIQLLDYQCITNDDNITLNWSTATETNNKEFQVWRSGNNGIYVKIGVISGNGTSTTQNLYQFIDLKPFLGINYYKLVQIDLDGSESVLKTIFCVFNHNIEYSGVIYTTILGQITSFDTLSIGWYIKEYIKENMIIKRELYYKF